MSSILTDKVNSISINKNVSVFSRSVDNVQNISSVSIAIASPDDILSWSYGEVKKSETISYRTYKPEGDGLFSAKIFGPVRDYECQCGKYRRIKYKGITCEKCGVEVTTSKVRRQRMGHIELVSPVCHILFLKGTSSPLSSLLGISVKDIERILHFASYVVIDPGNTILQKGSLLSEAEYNDLLDEYGDSFKAGLGAEALQEMLANIDLKNSIELISEELKETKSEVKKRIMIKKLRLLNDFHKSGNRPEWIMLNRIPILPPDLRPLVQLDGGRFVSSDINELYRSIINRNERLSNFIATKAPSIILNNEKRLLQESVDSLFDNAKRSSPTKSPTGRVLKSLSDSLRGKQGRFRQNLLGKRVDYSGRSVIMVGPNLQLHEFGLPKHMALELFKPFIFSVLLMTGRATSVKMAKRMVEKQEPEVWSVLELAMEDHLVYLNRAPTLHRLNIQAFSPKLIEAKAIQLHPLVCKAFNADFDGDQMAVHVPLSLEAQMEAWVLMLSSNNILSPQNGQPIILPSKDIVVGLYYITAAKNSKDGDILRSFDNLNDIIFALDNDLIKINDKIKYYYSYTDHSDEKEARKTFSATTTAGVVMLFDLLPKDGGILFEEINLAMNNKVIADLLTKICIAYNQEEVVRFSNEIVSIGFKYSTKSGISFGKDDMVIPETKEIHVQNALNKIKIAEEQYNQGYITFREKYNQVTDRWSECTDLVAKDMMNDLGNKKNTDDVNSIYIMMLSGARVSEPVMRQIAAMRGLITKPSGEIIETPIISNFKEGMTVLEYFNSAHGARKGAADTALKTADAGYLTRRLVDVARDCIITEEDCGSLESIKFSAYSENGKVTQKLSEVIFGRVIAKDIKSENGKVILKSGTSVDADVAKILDENGITFAEIRSPVLCQSEEGICSKCYGLDLSTRNLVNVGEAVGIIAAQSIGEPGAQLTMRTFHIGGATSINVEKTNIIPSIDGYIKLIDCETLVNREGVTIVVSNLAKISLIDSKDNIEKARFTLPYSASLFVKDGDKVSKGDLIAKWDPYNSYIISKQDGYASFIDIISGVSCYDKMEDNLGDVSYKIIKNWTATNKSLSPRVVILNKDGSPVLSPSGIGIAKYLLSMDSILVIEDGKEIKKGDVIARIPRESSQTAKDITGGLPKVEDVFEARAPKEAAIISEIDGYCEFLDDYKTKNRLVISSQDGSEAVTYNVPKNKRFNVSEGSFVQKGQVLVEGSLNPHDILHVEGIKSLLNYMIDEIQQVYKLQGVDINNKHIEIIVRYMLQKVEITHKGDLPYVIGQQYNLKKVLKDNSDIIAKKGEIAQYKRVLQGITRASIQTDSFISAASFQETTRVLVDAAIAGKKDLLKGMKENVIIGHLIPAGTGFVMNKIKKEAKLLSKSLTS